MYRFVQLFVSIINIIHGIVQNSTEMLLTLSSVLIECGNTHDSVEGFCS